MTKTHTPLKIKGITTNYKGRDSVQAGSKTFIINSVYVMTNNAKLTCPQVVELAYRLFGKRLRVTDVYRYRFLLRKLGRIAPFDTSVSLSKSGWSAAKRNHSTKRNIT